MIRQYFCHFQITNEDGSNEFSGKSEYLTIIPRARMGFESIAHEGEGQWAIDSEAMRARGIIALVKSN